MIKRIFDFAFYIFAILFCVWVILSWLEIDAFNLSTCEYLSFNFFVILSKLIAIF